MRERERKTDAAVSDTSRGLTPHAPDIQWPAQQPSFSPSPPHSLSVYPAENDRQAHRKAQAFHRMRVYCTHRHSGWKESGEDERHVCMMHACTMHSHQQKPEAGSSKSSNNSPHTHTQTHACRVRGTTTAAAAGFWAREAGMKRQRGTRNETANARARLACKKGE